MAELSENELYLMADQLTLKWWAVPYDGLIELKKNRRWKSINGRFCAPQKVPWGEGIPPIIQMCVKRNADRTIEEVKGTLLHELVHWRLFSCGIPNRDTDAEFVKEILRVGASLSKTRKAQLAYENYQRGLMS